MDDPCRPPETVELTRESIQAGTVIKMVSAQGLRVLTDAERAASITDTLAARPANSDGSGDLWLFGYGSLIWNPAFHFTERRKGRIHGWHRSFCLYSPEYRGTREPGRLAGDPQGVCDLQVQVLSGRLIVVVRRGFVDFAISIQIAHQQRKRVTANKDILSRCEFPLTKIDEHADRAAFNGAAGGISGIRDDDVRPTVAVQIGQGD